MRPALRVGIGGPVGAGKTTLMAELCLRLRDRFQIAVITNDVNAREDARLLIRNGVLAEDRIVGLDAGTCPHTTLGDDASLNLAAVDRLIALHEGLQLVFIEGADDLGASTFDPALTDLRHLRRRCRSRREGRPARTAWDRRERPPGHQQERPGAGRGRLAHERGA